MTRVLLVEDEVALAEPLTFLLTKEGFDIKHVPDGKAALAVLADQPVDIVLLDIMLPSISGTEVLQKLRESSDVPVIMLTAKDSEVDRIEGLEFGADDYVTKPYSTWELIARMRAVLRRGTGAMPMDDSEILEEGPVRMDLDRHTVLVNGQEVPFPLKEFELLEYLMRNSGRVLTRGQIIDRVWGADYVGDTKTLDVHIKRIRTKIEKIPKQPKYLLTIRGLGYRFVSS